MIETCQARFVLISFCHSIFLGISRCGLIYKDYRSLGVTCGFIMGSYKRSVLNTARGHGGLGPSQRISRYDDTII